MLRPSRWVLGRAVGLLLLALAQSACSGVPSGGNLDVVAAPQNHPLRQFFVAQNPQWPLIKCVAGDLNNDGREDLIVIYQIAPDTNRMVVVIDRIDGYVMTNAVPAPVSHQQVQFRDIDHKPPLEFIVRGMKGNQAGMAIYRVTGESLENLFGEGMSDCCN